MAFDSPISTTFALGTSSFTAQVASMTPPEFARNKLTKTLLNSADFREYLPGKLQEPGEIEMTVYFDPDDIPPNTAVAETVTITFPIPSGGIAGATLVGTGFLISWQIDEMSETEDDAMKAALTWAFDGGTGPTWTASS